MELLTGRCPALHGLSHPHQRHLHHCPVLVSAPLLSRLRCERRAQHLPHPQQPLPRRLPANCCHHSALMLLLLPTSRPQQGPRRMAYWRPQLPIGNRPHQPLEGRSRLLLACPLPYQAPLYLGHLSREYPVVVGLLLPLACSPRSLLRGAFRVMVHSPAEWIGVSQSEGTTRSGGQQLQTRRTAPPLSPGPWARCVDGGPSTWGSSACACYIGRAPLADAFAARAPCELQSQTGADDARFGKRGVRETEVQRGCLKNRR
mmetsp:Transcript_16067/g.44784  ORF Transcript_16067/g.44784 Transcript_16067/m.44784 type:complete len:259 (-) Transcript_16067:27-803(-)